MSDEITIEFSNEILELEFPSQGVTLELRTPTPSLPGGGSGQGLLPGGTAGQIIMKRSSLEGDYGFISRNAPNGYAGLDGQGKVPDELIPALSGIVYQHSGFGPPPDVIPGAEPGDIYLDLESLDLYQLT